MAGFGRKKRVTDLLDDEAKARLVGADHRKLSYESSGSEHSGASDGESLSLSELVHDFLEDNGNECDSAGNDFDSELVDSVTDCMDSVEDLLSLTANTNVDPYRNLLQAHVSEAVEKFQFLREKNVSVLRRNVMLFLREKKHNAGICKTRWDFSGGITAGNHEFIDVVRSGPSTCENRYIVELDFAGQFEIARPTSKYYEVMSYVPGIFVGTAEELKRTILFMCGFAKRCFRSRGLSLPPWRKSRYMLNKWFAPYHRTTNPVQGNPVPAVVSTLSSTKCRLVGFDHVVSDAKHGGISVRTK